MSAYLARAMMNRGSAHERAQGRMLARGRTRFKSADMAKAYALADRVIKDFSGAGNTTTGDQVHTDTAGPDSYNPERKHTPRRETRLDRAIQALLR